MCVSVLGDLVAHEVSTTPWGASSGSQARPDLAVRALVSVHSTLSQSPPTSASFIISDF